VQTGTENSPTRAIVEARLAAAVPDGSIIISGVDPQDPDLLLLSPNHGLIALDVFDDVIATATPSQVKTTHGYHRPNPLTAFAPKIERLRELSQEFSSVPVHAAIYLAATDAGQLQGVGPGLPSRLVIASDRLEATLDAWESALDQEAVEQFALRLAPASTLEATLEDVLDPGRQEREDLRSRLDEEQARIADGLGDGVTVIEGVAGSGKSLVLAARAQSLAREHPDWDIEVVCYNRVLVPYLKRLIGNHPNVSVDTAHGWMASRGIRQPNFRAENFDEQLQDRLEAALADEVGLESADAVLVDEAQDLTAAMLRLMRSAVRPGRGGMLVVRDLSQSLYLESTDVLREETPTRTVLRRNYRNAGQIGRFALGSVFGTVRSTIEAHDPRRPPEPEFVTEGEKVQVVWGDSWNDQAAFVARESRRLVQDGVVAWEDIGVLYTQFRGQTNRLLDAFEAEKIPHRALTWDRESRKAFDLAAPGVKLLTVHSAKGLEFPVVFLFGVEALRVPESIEDAEVEEANFTRVAYVGMTRAKDLLYLTYTRPNVIVRRCLELAEDAVFKRFPDDFAS
jgi:hypothetical protein